MFAPAASARSEEPAARQAIRFVLVGSGVVDGRENRAFRIQSGNDVIGALSIACERGEMVSAAYRPNGENGDTAQIASRADNRLCHSDDLRL